MQGPASPVHGVLLSAAGVSKLLLTDSAAHLPAFLNTLLLYLCFEASLN